MAVNKKLTKKELIEILVNDYGYDKEDLRDADGKPFTNAKMEAIIKEEERDAKKLEHEETATALADSFEIRDEDMISVMSGVEGEFIHRSQKTGRMWKFTRFGQTDKMPFIELMTIYNNNPKCFEQGRLIVMNEQVVKNFSLGEIYKNIITPKNLDEIFTKQPEEIKEIIANLPHSMKNTFFARARQLYSTGKLDSIRVTRVIEEAFGISLEDNAPISDIAISFGDK